MKISNLKHQITNNNQSRYSKSSNKVYDLEEKTSQFAKNFAVFLRNCQKQLAIQNIADKRLDLLIPKELAYWLKLIIESNDEKNQKGDI